MEQKALNRVVLSLGTAVILGLAGCSNSSDSGATTGGTTGGITVTSTTTNGTASDGYIKEAVVCLDMNLNNKCDNNVTYTEPFTVTDANGSYSLVVSAADKTKAAANAPLLLVGGTDIDTLATLSGTFKAPFDATATTTTAQITPLTTLVSAMVDKNISVNTAYKQVAKALGLSETQVKSDPVQLAKDGDTKVIQAAMTIHRIITTMAKSASVENSKIYSDLVTAINTVADDNTSTTKSIATIVTAAAAETNSTLPPKAKEAAKVADTIEKTISDAITNQESIEDAALASDEVVNSIQTTVQTALDNNTTINDAFVASVDTNASTTLGNVDPVKTAIRNLLISYFGEPEAGHEAEVGDAVDAVQLKANFSKSSEVTVEAIFALNDTISPTNPQDNLLANLLYTLQEKYTAKQIRTYVLNLGYTISADAIADVIGSNREFTSAMTKEAFATMIYDTENPELMTLALQINPPANIASMSDVQKAKNLFTSVRTQVNQADTFTQSESTKIDTALQSVTNSVTFTSIAFNGISSMISEAVDTNQTKVSQLVSGNTGNDRNVTVSKSASSGNVVWNYTIKDTNVDTPWSGSVTYTDVLDSANFDPSSFTTVTAKLTGTLPIDEYGATIASGKTNSQNVDANIKVVKTTDGATLHLDAVITNNDDSVSIKDANIVVAYTTKTNTDGTKEPLPTYVELKNLYVNGTVGAYTLDGKLDVNAYAINKIGAAKGFDHETTYSWLGGQISCDGNINIDPNSITFTYNSVTYNEAYPNNAWYNYDTNKTSFSMGFDNVAGSVSYTDATNFSNYGGLAECTNPQINYFNSDNWTEDDLQNSGHLPSQLTFNGTLTNNVTSAYLNATVNAKWTNIVDANLSDENFVPYIDATITGKLAMPESPVMNVTLKLNTTATDKTVNVTYVNGDTSVTANSVIQNANDKNITVNLSSTAGIQAKIITVNGDVDYATSTLKNTAGDTIGSFVDRAGTPAVKYVDGTFESLF